MKHIFEDIIAIACLCVIGYGFLVAAWAMS